MELYSGICGSYPRPPELRKAIDRYEKGYITKEELNSVYLKSLRMIIEIQERAGLNIISSGLLMWDDLLRPFAKGLEGIKLDGLLRFFDNNFYYRVPVIVDKIRRKKPIVLSEAKNLAKHTTRLKKLVLPGPFTFIQLSRNEYYSSMRSLADDILDALVDEIKELAKFIDFLQIDEPSLVDSEVPIDNRKEGVNLVNELVSRIVIPRDKIIVATYFHLDEQCYQILLNLKTGLHIDMVSTPRKAFNALKEYGFKGDLISLGLIDSRNIKVENVEKIANKAYDILDEIHAKAVIFSTNTWLDYIPFENARSKVEVLGKLLQIMRGEVT